MRNDFIKYLVVSLIEENLLILLWATPVNDCHYFKNLKNATSITTQ